MEVLRRRPQAILAIELHQQKRQQKRQQLLHDLKMLQQDDTVIEMYLHQQLLQVIMEQDEAVM